VRGVATTRFFRKRRYVLGHDTRCELLWLVDNKASTVRLPRDNVRHPIRLDLFQYLIQLLRKRRLHSPLGLDIQCRRIFSGVSMIAIAVNDNVPIVQLGRLVRSKPVTRLLRGGMKIVHFSASTVAVAQSSSGPRRSTMLPCFFLLSFVFCLVRGNGDESPHLSQSMRSVVHDEDFRQVVEASSQFHQAGIPASNVHYIL
jgi:hypothetical protein